MQKELIFQVMNGEIVPGLVEIPECLGVVDEFGDGRECAQLYARVYDAEMRLLEKLGGDEDRDIEEIVHCMGSISKILAMKMFDYGERMNAMKG